MGRRQGARGPGVLRHPQPRRHAVRRRSAPGAAAPRAGRSTSRASRSTSRPTSSSSTSSRPSRASARSRSTRASFFDLTTNDVTGSLRKQTIRTLEAMGIPVEYSFHEDAPSQQEIDLRHTDALTMADSVMTFRLDRPRGRRRRRACTPRSCPSRSRACRAPACTPTCRCSAATTTRSSTTTTTTTCRRLAKSFMAGLLRHAAEITAITNQTVNSYKRLVPGFEAPVHVSWARNNRSGLIRVPIAKRGNPIGDPHRVPLAGSGVQPVPRVQPAARGRHARRRRGLRAAGRGRRQPVRDRRRGARQARRSSSSRSRCPTRCGRWRSPSSSTRRSASTSSSGSCATSAREWRGLQDPRVRRSRSTAT